MQDEIENSAEQVRWPDDGFEDPSGSSLALPCNGHEASEAQITIDTYLRHPQLFIDVNMSADPAEIGRVIAYRIREKDAERLPNWLRTIRNGFLSGEPPSGKEEISLDLEVILRDAAPLEFTFSVDCRTGVLHADGQDNRQAGLTKDVD